MGTPEFAVPSLATLIRNGYPIPAVVTGQDKPRGRGQLLSPTPIKQLALQQGLQVLQPEDLRDPEFVQRISELQPDLIVVVAFRILPRELFTLPRSGSFNLHASLLPKYRGAAPVNWAIIKGERETGVTTFFLREKVDTGNIILQESVPIGEDDDAGTLHDRLSSVGATVVLRTVQLIERGQALPLPQDDSEASPAPKIFKEDCRIEWRQPAELVHNLVRGLSPSPAAFTTYEGRILKIFKTRILPAEAAKTPGTIKVTEHTLHVATADRMIAILELQQEAGKRMSVEEFLRGHKLADGELLH
jgi:methionyl-tRNA formyltransferase